VRHKLLLFSLLLLIGLPWRILGQNPPTPPHLGGPPFSREDPSQQKSEENENGDRLKKAMEKKLNEQRHEQLKRDTDKLLELSTELKQYVDKTNENVLSVDVVKKAEEIEKLAHSVKEKMKGN